MATAFITGAAGFVGSHLAERFVAEGWHVVGIDNLVTGSLDNVAPFASNDRFTFVQADAAVRWSWAETLKAPFATPHVILHFASPASPVHYGRLPLETMAVNSVGVMHAVAEALRHDARLVFASTSESYGDPSEHPQRETYWGNVNPIGHRSCYDESKRFGEAYVTSAVRTMGFDGRVVRIFNTYGPRMQSDDGRVIPSFCLSALRGRPLTIFGDGSQTRSFCYVDDLIEGVYRYATTDGLAGRVVNLGNPNEFTIYQLAEIIAESVGVPFRVEPQPLPPDDPTRRRPDITLARRLLDWEPRTSLSDGLSRTLSFFRERLALQTSR